MTRSRQSACKSLFLRNAWYAGGFAEELDTRPMFFRKILGNKAKLSDRASVMAEGAV